MPEQRARKYHQDRVAETLRDEISTMIQGELSDPRIGSAHVTEVVLNAGGKSARVYVRICVRSYCSPGAGVFGPVPTTPGFPVRARRYRNGIGSGKRSRISGTCESNVSGGAER